LLLGLVGWDGSTMRPLLGLMDALYIAGAYTLAGVVIAHFVRAIGAWITPRPAAVPVALIPPAPIVDGGTVPAPAAPELAPTSSVLSATVGTIRRCILAHEWEEAGSLLADLAAEAPDDPRLETLQAELGQARDTALEEHLAQLDAARQVNDPL